MNPDTCYFCGRIEDLGTEFVRDPDGTLHVLSVCGRCELTLPAPRAA